LYRIEEIGFYYCRESNLRFFHPAVTGSESFYEKLQKFDWYYLDDKAEYACASQFIKESDSVLEIGSGKGAFAKKIKTQRYVGLEFSQEAQRLASMNGISILSESIQDHAIAHPEKYDVVCSFQVLEHVADLNSFIKASVGCLKPGGILIYSVPSADSFISLTKNNILNMPPHHISWFSDICLEYIGEKFNLKAINIIHEKVADIHKEWYASSIVFESLSNLLGSKFSLVERSIKYKILSKLAQRAGWFVAKGLSDERSLPIGHSVTVIYEK
jgi:cyclopropane fatty-acyl-phospholipid synthase-like methyltransferase